MTNNRSALVLMSVLAFSSLAGCGKKASEIDFGDVKDSVYRNEYFGLSLRLPPEWIVHDQEKRQRIVDSGKEMLAGKDKALKATLKAPEQQSITLLVASKYTNGASHSNPNIMCVAAQIGDLPGINRGRDYHSYTKRLMQSGQLNLDFRTEISTEMFGGIDFDVMHVAITSGGVTVRQKYYAAIMKGYALNFIVSFRSSDEESVFQNILESISFQ